MICGYDGVRIEERVKQKNGETLLRFSLKHSKSTVRQKQLLNNIERSGDSPFLYPVTDEVGYRIHVYWVNELRDYLDAARQTIEENLTTNWSFYHSTSNIPSHIFRSYLLYVIEPAYDELNSFINKNDYSYFYLTEDLILELVRAVFEGDISKADNVNYVKRIVQVYPLSVVAELLDNFVEEQTPVKSSAPLVSWIQRNSLTSTVKLMKPEFLRPALERAFLIKMLLLRLYPQENRLDYDKALREMLLTTNYVVDVPHKLLVSRLRDEQYYKNLLKEVRSTISIETGVKRNTELFMRDLGLYTIPFKYDVGETEEAAKFTDVRGREVYRFVEKDKFPVVHKFATNLFIPPPGVNDKILQRVRTREDGLLQRICGRHRKRLLERKMGVFDVASGTWSMFVPTTSEITIHLRPKQRCLSLSPSRCRKEKRLKTIAAVKTFGKLLQIFVRSVNSVNKDELRRLYAEAYPQLTESPKLLAYTTAYGPQITQFMVDKYLGSIIKSQLANVWNSIEGKIVADENITAVYIILALMLSPQFKTFLTEENQEIAEAAWNGLETVVHEFVDSRDACATASVGHVSQKEKILCVLKNSMTLMRLTHPQLRKYHKVDITQ